MTTDNKDLCLGVNQKLILRLTLHNIADVIDGPVGQSNGRPRALRAFDTILNENRYPSVQLLRIALSDLKEAYSDVDFRTHREKLNRLFAVMDELLTPGPQRRKKRKVKLDDESGERSSD